MAGSLLRIQVDFNALPTSPATDAITLATLRNGLFEDVSLTDARLGETQYRCVYLANTHAANALYGVYFEGDAQTPSGAQMAWAQDLAGIGNGTTTGVAAVVTSITTEPSPPPSWVNTRLTVGTLLPGQCCAVWIRRTVPARGVRVTPNDVWTYRIGGSYDPGVF